MAIQGVGIRSPYLGTQILNLQRELDELQVQLATGKKSMTYAGMGANRGFAISLRAQISSIDGFADTMANVNTRLNLTSSALSRMISIGTDIHGAAVKSPLDLNDKGQTAGQTTAYNSLVEMLQLLNTRAGERYLFSGRATDTPATASIDDILDGVGSKAGLKQLISERKQADIGDGLGRLQLATPTPTSISITEDAPNSPFGLKLRSVSSAGITVNGPAGPPAAGTVDLGAANPSDGDTIALTFELPDGSLEKIQLTATTTAPPQAGQFLIGADSTETAANLTTALTTAVGNLANGALVAASAIKASSEFFTGSPLRVDGPPFGTATAQVPGTSDNTVSWYTGEDGPDSPRGTAVAQVDQSMSIQYGARANEQAITWQLQNIAAYAVVSTSVADPNAKAQVSALNARVAQNLSKRSGQQAVQDIQADFAGAQTAAKAASDRQKQTKSAALTMLDSIEGISDDEVATKILTLQTSLSASYQTTAILYQTSLLKYLGG